MPNKSEKMVATFMEHLEEYVTRLSEIIDEISYNCLHSESSIRSIEHYLQREDDLTEDMKMEIEEAKNIISEALEKNSDLMKTIQQLTTSVHNIGGGKINCKDEDEDEDEDYIKDEVPF